MNAKVLLVVLFSLLLSLDLLAESSDLSAKSILTKDSEQLAFDLHDVSEAGQDRAAQFWATAKRLESETKLAETSVAAVMRLAYWREVLNRWQDLWLNLQSLESGGGTMWGHLSARNDAWLEVFLAEHLDGLSVDFADVEENVDLDTLDDAKQFVKEAKSLAKETERDIDQICIDTLQQVDEMQEALLFSVAGIRDAKTRKAVNQWLLEKTKGLFDETK